MSNIKHKCQAAVKGLLEFIERIVTWITQSNDFLESTGFEQDQRVWTGKEGLLLFETELFLTTDTLPIYYNFYNTIIEFSKEATPQPDVWSNLDIAMNNYNNYNVENDNNESNNNNNNSDEKDKQKYITNLISLCRPVLEKLFLVLRLMMEKNSNNIDSYRVVIQKGRDQKTQKIDFTLNLWCLSAHITFRNISAECHSINLSRNEYDGKNTNIPPVVIFIKVKIH